MARHKPNHVSDVNLAHPGLQFVSERYFADKISLVLCDLEA